MIIKKVKIYEEFLDLKLYWEVLLCKSSSSLDEKK